MSWSDVALNIERMLGGRKARIISSLPGRKSHVYLLHLGDGEEKAVAKVYLAPGAAEHEWRVLDLLNQKHIEAPKPLAFDSTTLIRGYIEGDTVGALISQDTDSAPMVSVVRRPPGSARDFPGYRHTCTVPSDYDISRLLSGWLFRFHETCSDRAYIVGDMNLRNFVLDSKESLMGIDFGDTREGDPLTDLGELCMFVLTHIPAFTVRRWDMAMAAVHHYAQASQRDLSPRIICPHISDSLRCAAERRGHPELAELAEELLGLWEERWPEFRDNAGPRA